MVSKSGSQRLIRFNVFEVDLAARQLRKSGLRVRLQDQPFRLLEALIERAGEAVTREELKDRLWPEDTFVEFDHSLNTAVKKLRQALDDSAESPRWIETIPRVGYRFMGEVVQPARATEEPEVTGLATRLPPKSLVIAVVDEVGIDLGAGRILDLDGAIDGIRRCCRTVAPRCSGENDESHDRGHGGEQSADAHESLS